MQKLIYLFLALLLLHTSCNPHKKNSAFQQLNLNIPSDPSTLDPRKGGDVVSSTLHFLLFDGLMRGNPDGSLSLSLAESYEISEDRKTYTFYLKNSFWSNGTPITAYDFEQSWKDILDPEFPAVNAHLLYPIKNAEAAKRGKIALEEVGLHALSSNVFEVVLEQPTPYFLELISFCVFFPVCKDAPPTEGPIVGSGPFILKKWKHDYEILLEKNQNYHRKDEIRLDRLHFSMVKNETTALQMYEKGLIDILGQPVLALPLDSVAELTKKNMIKTRPLAATTFCAFNVQQFPFNNCNIRKAFALAIDRQEIVKNVTALNEKVALEMIPPCLKKNHLVHFFQDAATDQALTLFQKGCEELDISPAEFPEVSYYYSNSEQHYKIAQALQQQWQRNLHVKVNLVNLEHKILMQKLSKKDFTMAQTYWIAQYNDPMNILERFKFKENTKNYPHWENEEYIRLLNQSLVVPSEEERRKLMHKAEALFIEEMPLAPIFHWSCAFIAKPYVKSFDLAPLGNGYFEKIYIDHKK
ncbi:MAG TPA: peptide ABC transporter substrate-binding protein [Rhabdochlamydiaceae bacterium]|nr:peptide ABC transporter substrate-binding protein [Rhabdochlamydiaceae bacterium]